MSYQTYITEAIVCGSFLHNTADKVFVLFTREAGMLYATARSVREERSKQRPALQEFSQIRVSLVKGKQGWRIGSVVPGPNYFATAKSREARGSVVMLMKTLRRFVHGEEAHSLLFDFCVGASRLLISECQKRSFLELAVQLRILDELGYVDSKDIPKNFKVAPASTLAEYESELSAEKMKKLIDNAVANSHL
ncbi:MAG: recombination protein O N-terminal domain-containing protein [Candidatus Nomurabacteria bacterium]|nr:recombination protein O N-terminal domain-containing protein [Candidatus Nomurabacteria bacterium]USN88205.1 MAG: recombination protein O N-terminal domain-containing protein [Candidatus Nomurabacteria bacterium]